MIDMNAIWQRWEAVGSTLDERGRRLFAAVEARTAGWGGLAAVARITGLALSTIGRGQDDLDAEPLPQGGCGAPAAGVTRFARRIRGWSQPSRSWSRRRRWAIRCGPCCGCRRAGR